LSSDQIVSSIVKDILIPFVAKSAEPVASKFGQKAADKIEGLYRIIKSKFSPDPYATRNIQKFEEDPERYNTEIEHSIEEKFEEEPSFKENILSLVKEIQQEPSVTIYLEKLKGNKIIGQNVKNMKNGTSDITIRESEGKEISGQVVENMGND
jgi:hypothetical protein